MLIILLSLAFAEDCSAHRQATPTCRIQCDAGVATSCHFLGYLLETGLGVPQPTSKPDNEVRFHSEFDDKYGGFAPERPPEVRDIEGAKVAYGRACTLGLADGCLSLGVLQRLEGDLDAAKSNFELAFSGWHTACDGGDGRSCQNIAASWWGNWGHEKDATESYNWSVRACKLDDGRGCWAQANVLLAGTVVPKDVNKAESLHKKSCDALNTIVGCLALRDFYDEAGAKPDSKLKAHYDKRACAVDATFCEQRR